jgi:hypothetical protein
VDRREPEHPRVRAQRRAERPPARADGGDLWEHYAAGNRATLLDLAAWHAAGRADRVVLMHPGGTLSEVTAASPAGLVAAVRVAAGDAGTCGTADIAPAARTLACAADPDRLALLAEPAEGSAALLVDGSAPAPWTPVTPGDLLAGLVPAP